MLRSSIEPPYSIKDENSCQLMDGFGLVIQLVLFLTVLTTLAYKRAYESPQRPVQIWALDVSKQFIGAGMIHFINIGISYAAIVESFRPQNSCVWYFSNLAVDTTLGVFILWCWLQLLYRALEKLHVDSGGATGDYGPPPLKQRCYRWVRQMTVFLSAAILTKICLCIFLIYSPWLVKLGELALSWTKDQPRLQLVFVMLIFPLIMNALQFWLTDTILKVQHNLRPANNESKSNSLSGVTLPVYIDHSEQAPLLSPLPKQYMSS
ncbi:vacuolar membrane protein-domain-containing protein [Choanephora cucurbitarum]|nr:vacuolar membrane protein-domain-containing protein [Choanephora cucurbitarum]